MKHKQHILIAALLTAAMFISIAILHGDTAQRITKERNKALVKLTELIRLKETKTLVFISNLDSLGRAYYEGIKGQVPEGKTQQVSICKINRIKGVLSLDSAYALLVKSVSLKAGTGDSSSDKYLPEMYLRHEISLVDGNGAKLWTKHFDWTTGSYMNIVVIKVSRNASSSIISLPDTAWDACKRGDFPRIMTIIDKKGYSYIRFEYDSPALGPILSDNGRYVAFGDRMPTVEWKVEWTIHDLVKVDSVKLICNQGEDQPDIYDDGRIEILKGYNETIYYFDSLKVSLKGSEK